MNDEGCQSTTLRGLNVIDSQFDIYILSGNEFRLLQWDHLEFLYEANPQVMYHGEWCLATPAIIQSIIADPDSTLLPRLPGLDLELLRAGIVPTRLQIPLTPQATGEKRSSGIRSSDEEYEIDSTSSAQQELVRFM